jgi:gamma-glutamyl-gamma-aminobutyrate hydrolase PuuD
MRLVSIGNYFGAHKPFLQMFKEFAMARLDEDFEFKPTDVVLFGGGADISPSIYKHKVSRFSGAGKMLSERDYHEVKHFKQAVKAGAGIIGICRGAQLACAMSGGSLIQHVDNHTNSHLMTTNDDRKMVVSSVHHQMMNPENTEHELIGYSTEILSPVHIVQDESSIELEKEPEVIFFKDTRALAIQYHPEFMNNNDEAVDFARQLVEEKFNVRTE